MKRRGFTLVELLVVVSIIGLLIALLLPALASAKLDAERVACAANVRTLVQGVHIYANNCKGQFPWSYSAYWPFGGQAVEVSGAVPVGQYPTCDFGSLYAMGILTNPTSIYCPLSGYMGADGPYANYLYTPRNGVAMGAPYLPTAVRQYLKSGTTTNWAANLAWYGVYSSYCYWYQKPNRNVLSANTSTYGIWINPQTQIGTRIDYAIPNENFTQSPIDAGSTILVSDITASYLGSWGAGPFLGGAEPTMPLSNHFTAAGSPDGSNIGYNDGSVAWKPFNQMHVGFVYNYDFYR